MIIEKKIWPKYFEEILKGNKTYELRLADFECRPGDILVLREFNPVLRQFTGRQIEKEVGYVGKTKDIKFWPKEDIEKYGFQIISLK